MNDILVESMAIMRFKCLRSFKIRVSLHQAYSEDYSVPYFPHPHQDSIKDILEKKKADSFISSYKFEDKKLGINKKFRDALKLPASEEKNLIINDLLLQMERAVSSSSYQFWLGPLREITSTKTYPSSSNSVPNLAT